MKPSWSLQDEEDQRHDQWLQGQPRLEDLGVDCPEGTIPIIRKTSKDHSPDVKDPSYINRFNDNTVNAIASAGREVREIPLLCNYACPCTHTRVYH